MITGKDLISMGYTPGKWFADAINQANSYNLIGEDLRQFLDTWAPKIVEPHGSPVSYHKNIKAETAEEEVNVASVIRSMDEVMTTPTIVGGAIMPDACPTGPGQIPVGGVAVAKNAIHPSFHSADICCSVMLTRLGDIDPKFVLDAAMNVTHFGGGGRNDGAFILPGDIEDEMRSNTFFSDKAIEMAHTHLGTQGDGNHFLFVGTSKLTGKTCIVTHHGSRGVGAELFRAGMKCAESFRRVISPRTSPKNAWIPFDAPEGRGYWAALQTTRKWTKQNHRCIHDHIQQRVGYYSSNWHWNEHNFVFKHGDLFYHAKGATPLDDAFVPDSKYWPRIIPLNMGEPILLISGITTETNLGFAPHGAGRNISRSEHIRGLSGRSVSDVLSEETKGLDVRFFSGNPDLSELPSAYKNAQSVKDQMTEFGLGVVIDEIIPYGCIMAGDWQKDAPWRKKKSRNNDNP